MASRRRAPLRDPMRLGDLVALTAPGKAAANVMVTRAVWEEVAGVGFARRTQPERVSKGTLYVAVASAGWAQELALAEKVIVERLRAKGVEVERLRFKVQDVAPPERGGVYAPAKRALEEARKRDLPVEAARAIERVKGDDLKEAMAKAARAAARRQAEIELIEKARSEPRALPRVPGKKKK